MNEQSQDYVKRAVEAILFISEKPVTLDQIKEALETVGPVQIKNTIQELQQEYETERRGMTILEIAEGYQMLSSPHYASLIRNFFKTRVKEKLSRPALETLAILAYKQPVSRTDIEMIRGVNSDGVMAHLLNKGLIKIVGRKDIPGRPYLYGTTKLFLEYFGLKSLEDLPKLEEFPALLKATESVSAALAQEESSRTSQESPTEELPLGAVPVEEEQPAPAEDSSQVEDPKELKQAMEEIQSGESPTDSPSSPANDFQEQQAGDVKQP